jgi:cytochrome b
MQNTTVLAPGHADRNKADHGTPRGGGESAESAMGELNNVLANITLGLVVLHILGVALASIVHHENLLLAMVSGRKRLKNASHPKRLNSSR